jgi:hypothetical protein
VGSADILKTTFKQDDGLQCKLSTKVNKSSVNYETDLPQSFEDRPGDGYGPARSGIAPRWKFRRRYTRGLELLFVISLGMKRSWASEYSRSGG